MPQPTITPQELVAKWRGDTRKERSVSQEYFINLCALIGHETPGDNRDGTLAFEEGADKGASLVPILSGQLDDQAIQHTCEQYSRNHRCTGQCQGDRYR